MSHITSDEIINFVGMANDSRHFSSVSHSQMIRLANAYIKLQGDSIRLADALDQLLKAVERSVCNGSGPAQDAAR